MKQHEYLNELKESLTGKLSAEEINDIISDYESFFLSGREEGKSDDEISSELGSPAFIAKSMTDTHDKTQVIQLNRHIANPGRRLFAYFIDAIIAVLPAFIITFVLGYAILSYFLLIFYPSPLVGASSYLGYASFQEFSTTDSNPNKVISVSGASNQTDVNTVKRPSSASIAFAALGLLFYITYSSVCSLIFKGQTIGKRLMHIKVCNSDAKQISKGHILIRELLGKVLFNSIPIISFISLFTILFTKEHKALHDMLADTIVTEA